jgi:hypothetical protein
MDHTHGTFHSLPLLKFSLTHLQDTTNKLSDPDSQGTRFLNLQHQPARNPFLSALYPSTPILDLGFRENQPEILSGADEPGLGDPIVDCARDIAGKVSAQQLGEICD